MQIFVMTRFFSTLTHGSFLRWWNVSYPGANHDSKIYALQQMDSIYYYQLWIIICSVCINKCYVQPWFSFDCKLQVGNYNCEPVHHAATWIVLQDVQFEEMEKLQKQIHTWTVHLAVFCIQKKYLALRTQSWYVQYNMLPYSKPTTCCSYSF